MPLTLFSNFTFIVTQGLSPWVTAAQCKNGGSQLHCYDVNKGHFWSNFRRSSEEVDNAVDFSSKAINVNKYFFAKNSWKRCESKIEKIVKTLHFFMKFVVCFESVFPQTNRQTFGFGPLLITVLFLALKNGILLP